MYVGCGLVFRIDHAAVARRRALVAAALCGLVMAVVSATAWAAGSAYVTNSNAGGNSVSQYDIGAGGLLTAKSSATVAAATTPLGVAVSPDGKSVYVATSGGMPTSVRQYDVGAGGALTAKSPATVPGGGHGLAVSPDGKSVVRGQRQRRVPVRRRRGWVAHG